MKIKLYKKLLIIKYLKMFFVIFFGLTMFFTIINLISNLDKLPHSANLNILYFLNIFLYFSTLTFSLSLVYAMISSVISHIKSNELVVIYSLGTSKKEIIKPYLIVMGIFIFLFLFLKNSAFFAGAKQVADNILHYNQVSRYESNLFLKFKSNYIFIKELNKFQKKGKDITIFDTKKQDLIAIYKAKEGEFKNNFWILKDVNITLKPKVEDTILNKKLNIKYVKQLEMLHGFKPNIMDSIYKGSNGLTLYELVEAIILLKDKGIKISALKANLYDAIFSPFFALFISTIMFIKLPIQRRGVNLAWISSSLYFITLVLWGILFIMGRMSKNGVFPPEIGILLPIFLIGVYAVYTYNTKFDKMEN